MTNHNKQKILEKHNRQHSKGAQRREFDRLNRPKTSEDRRQDQAKSLGARAAALLAESERLGRASDRSADLGFEDRAGDLSREARRADSRAHVYENLRGAKLGDEFQRNRTHSNHSEQEDRRSRRRIRAIRAGAGVLGAAGAGLLLGVVTPEATDQDLLNQGWTPEQVESKNNWIAGQEDLSETPADMVVNIPMDQEQGPDYTRKGPSPDGN